MTPSPHIQFPLQRTLCGIVPMVTGMWRRGTSMEDYDWGRKGPPELPYWRNYVALTPQRDMPPRGAKLSVLGFEEILAAFKNGELEGLFGFADYPDAVSIGQRHYNGTIQFLRASSGAEKELWDLARSSGVAREVYFIEAKCGDGTIIRTPTITARIHGIKTTRVENAVDFVLGFARKMEKEVVHVDVIHVHPAVDLAYHFQGTSALKSSQLLLHSLNEGDRDAAIRISRRIPEEAGFGIRAVTNAGTYVSYVRRELFLRAFSPYNVRFGADHFDGIQKNLTIAGDRLNQHNFIELLEILAGQMQKRPVPPEYGNELREYFGKVLDRLPLLPENRDKALALIQRIATGRTD